MTYIITLMCDVYLSAHICECSASFGQRRLSTCSLYFNKIKLKK